MEKQATNIRGFSNFEKNFAEKGYKTGTDYGPANYFIKTFVKGLRDGTYTFERIPGRFKTGIEFFLYALSEIPGEPYKERKKVIDFVQADTKKFDREFFKNHIAADRFSLCGELNDFEIMPEEFIDEEMVACAMKVVLFISKWGYTYFDNTDKTRTCCADYDAWLYTVAKKKPELLTEDLFLLAARCFAKNVNGKNRLFEITPEKYRTEEFYWEMCIENDTRVLQGVPSNTISDRFLMALLNRNPANIRVFSEEFLERETPIMQGTNKAKFWQIALYKDKTQILNIPCNEERIIFYIENFNKESIEHNQVLFATVFNYLATNDLMMLDLSTGNNETNDNATFKYALLPATHYSKNLHEFYQKLGIKLLFGNFDASIYLGSLPEDISIIQDFKGKDKSGYYIQKEDKKILHFCNILNSNAFILEIDNLFIDIDKIDIL